MKKLNEKRLSCFLILMIVAFCSLNLSAQIPDQAGFPIHLGGSAPSECSPQVADIDGDGDLEVLMGGGQSLYVFHDDGIPVTGFPVYLGFVIHHAVHTPAVADLDNDGVMDIVMAGQRSELYVFNNDGTLKTGWPQEMDDDDGAASSPAVADLDGDGDLEIVIGTYKDLNGNNPEIDDARVYIFHHDGTRFTGWPVYDVDSYGVNSTPAIGDIDNDGDLEIIVCGRDNSKIWAWHTDGTVVTGFPVNIGGLCESSPTLADIDDDGDLEIFIPSGATVYGYHHDATAITGWPQSMSGGNERSSASIGDLDGDGDLEIVCGGPDGNVYAWHHTGVLVTGWPQASAGNFAQGTPAIADIDGDGDMEIIGGTYWGVYAWHHDGTLLPDYPLYTYWSRSSPTITDLDQDGDIEILIGSLDGNLYGWDLTGPYNADNIEWGMFRHNLLNTGNYHFGAGPPITGFISGNVSLEGGIGNVEEVAVAVGNISTNPDVNGDYLIEITVGTYDVTATLEYYDPDTVEDVLVEEGQTTGGIDFILYSSVGLEDNLLSSKITLIGNYPNPFNPETTISFSTTEYTENTEIIIYNLKGQMIRQYSIFNNQSSIVWDGTDDTGKPVSSGIYLYKLKAGNFIATRKMILMK